MSTYLTRNFGTGIQVLTHVAERLKDLHAAGYAHRDIKPGNIMWLPRQNRWTIIDFGCAARIGEETSLGFSPAYAAPEVIRAYTSGKRSIKATSAVDAWSVGVMAIELFTGKSVFDPFVIPKEEVSALYPNLDPFYASNLQRPPTEPGYKQLGKSERVVRGM